MEQALHSETAAEAGAKQTPATAEIPAPAETAEEVTAVTEIATFQFPATGQAVRTVTIDGGPWFVARDICHVVGIANPSDAVRSLDDDEYQVVPAALVSSEARPQDFLNIINEPGLYSLILRSRKPEARAFKRWVTHEVLPTIRKTGRYGVAERPITELEMAQRYVAALEREQRLTAELEVAAPKAEAWDVLASAHGDYSVREAAFILNRDPAIDTGQKRLFQLLRDWGLIDRRDIPYAAHARHVCLRARHYDHPITGEKRATDQVRITADGLRYLHRRMGGVQPLRLNEQLSLTA